MRQKVETFWQFTHDETSVLINTYINPDKHNISPIVNYSEAQAIHSESTNDELEDRGYMHAHLYVTVREEILPGDWYYNMFTHSVHKNEGDAKIEWCNTKCSRYRKVIASTDKRLTHIYTNGIIDPDTKEFYEPQLITNRAMPNISSKFIRKYCNAGGIHESMVDMEPYGYCGDCRKAGILHCAHADTCGNAVTLYKPVVDDAGDIKMHILKDNYTREEVAELMHDAAFRFGGKYHESASAAEAFVDDVNEYIDGKLT